MTSDNISYQPSGLLKIEEVINKLRAKLNTEGMSLEEILKLDKLFKRLEGRNDRFAFAL
ncbi:MAG: hypothetical protein HOG49_38850 [Candidatus Scalindua sp.]|mgnify:CR=1 FL=1|jgi:hypothetical protein|nr:hypothetical protein [Candidatus Scalindua sp.]